MKILFLCCHDSFAKFNWKQQMVNCIVMDIIITLSTHGSSVICLFWHEFGILCCFFFSVYQKMHPSIVYSIMCNSKGSQINKTGWDCVIKWIALTWYSKLWYTVIKVYTVWLVPDSLVERFTCLYWGYWVKKNEWAEKIYLCPCGVLQCFNNEIIATSTGRLPPSHVP